MARGADSLPCSQAQTQKAIKHVVRVQRPLKGLLSISVNCLPGAYYSGPNVTQQTYYSADSKKGTAGNKSWGVALDAAANSE